MGSRTTKKASDGTQTKCPNCGKPVRGQKGLEAHQKQCVANPAVKQKPKA